MGQAVRDTLAQERLRSAALRRACKRRALRRQGRAEAALLPGRALEQGSLPSPVHGCRHNLWVAPGPCLQREPRQGPPSGRRCPPAHAPAHPPAPLRGVSPIRPSYLLVLPPVDVAAASQPAQSAATAPTVCVWCVAWCSRLAVAAGAAGACWALPAAALPSPCLQRCHSSYRSSVSKNELGTWGSGCRMGVGSSVAHAASSSAQPAAPATCPCPAARPPPIPRTPPLHGAPGTARLACPTPCQRQAPPTGSRPCCSAHASACGPPRKQCGERSITRRASLTGFLTLVSSVAAPHLQVGRARLSCAASRWLALQVPGLGRVAPGVGLWS
jgi:hypothetical protein